MSDQQQFKIPDDVGLCPRCGCQFIEAWTEGEGELHFAPAPGGRACCMAMFNQFSDAIGDTFDNIPVVHNYEDPEGTN